MDVVPTLGAALRRRLARRGARSICAATAAAPATPTTSPTTSSTAPASRNGSGLKVESLSANPAVLTCLANDLGYENVYAEQLRVKAEPGDVLIVLSGSGKSPNVVEALEVGAAKGMTTFAILGFSGGRCKALAQHPIHFPVDDMQIAEDLQMVVGHICMQWLYANPLERPAASQAAE